MISDKETLDAIIEIIQKAHLKEFEGYNIGQALAYPVIYYEKKSIGCELKTVLVPIIKSHYDFDRMGNTGVALLFSSAYTKRKDHREKFEKIAAIMPESSIISTHKTRGIHVSNLAKLYKIVKWYRQINEINVNIPKQLKRYIVYWLFDLYCELNEVIKLEKKLKTPIHTFASYCDVLPSDSILTQYFNNTGRNTITFQHGDFNIKTLNGEIAYVYSQSKYFLCYGLFTKKQAMQVGVSASKMITVGSPEMIGESIPDDMQSVYTKKFGVSLSFFDQKDENIELLQCSLVCAKEIGFQCIIRPHPSLNMKEYDKYIDLNYMSMAPIGQSMDSFIGEIEFGIVGTSTVFGTFITRLLPVMRYVRNSEKDFYEGVDWCQFKTQDELMNLYKKMKYNKDWYFENLIKTRNFFIGEGDISQNYKEFFENLIVKQGMENE